VKEFLEKVADVLDLPGTEPDFEFRTAESWSSLAGFSLAVMIEQDYGKALTPEEFRAARTVADLAAAAGVA